MFDEHLQNLQQRFFISNHFGEKNLFFEGVWGSNSSNLWQRVSTMQPMALNLIHINFSNFQIQEALNGQALSGSIGRSLSGEFCVFPNLFILCASSYLFIPFPLASAALSLSLPSPLSTNWRAVRPKLTKRMLHNVRRL